MDMKYIIQTDDIADNTTSTWCREHRFFMDYVTPQSLYHTKGEADAACTTISKKVCYAFCHVAVRKSETTTEQTHDQRT